ncbi:MAG: site-2 protease family protein [Dehalococcoidia bacterium]|nr:site-2 protease family protein [Dehalococcoidia bacterium]
MILQYLDSFLKDPFATLLSLSLVLLSILVAVTIHEFSHALVSNKLGDTTAKSLGRLTLNPKSHLDPLGSLLFLFVGFGWGKPVPVDIYRIKKVPPLLGMSMVSFAGPASNLATAILIGFCLKKLALEFGLSDIWIELGFTFVQISLVLAVFNLVPLPPLDGYKVILGILPKGLSMQYSGLERYGPFALIILFLIDMTVPGVSILSTLIGKPVKILLNWIF